MLTTGAAREMIGLLGQQRTELIRQLAAEVETYIAVSQQEREKAMDGLGQQLARNQSLPRKEFEAIIQELGERSAERAGQILAALDYFSRAENELRRKFISPVGDGVMPTTDAREWRGQVNKLRSELESALLSFAAEQEEIKAELQRLAAAERVTVHELKHVVARLQEKWRGADVYLGDLENAAGETEGGTAKVRREGVIR